MLKRKNDEGYNNKKYDIKINKSKWKEGNGNMSELLLYKRLKTLINGVMPDVNELIRGGKFIKYEISKDTTFNIKHNKVGDYDNIKLIIFKEKNNTCIKIKSYSNGINNTHLSIVISESESDNNQKRNVDTFKTIIANSEDYNEKIIIDFQDEVDVDKYEYIMNLNKCKSYSLHSSNEYYDEKNTFNNIFKIKFYDEFNIKLPYELIISTIPSSFPYTKYICNNSYDLNIINYYNKIITKLVL